MMSIDALTAIENFASGIFSAGMEFLFTWGELLGIIGLIGHLMRARAEGRHSMGPGKFIAGIVICGMLVALPSFINAGGTHSAEHPAIAGLSTGSSQIRQHPLVAALPP